MVKIQCEDFDVGAELAKLRLSRPDIGAVAMFVGQVRDSPFNNDSDGSAINSLTLEHYPGMTEKALQDIVTQAKSRWDIFDALVIHRIGTLQPTDQIVMVAVAGAHRGEAFAACEFIMDYLKTQAPFWKKEQTNDGERWVEARASDDVSKARWDR